MNADDILKYGHLTVLGVLDGLSPADWATPGVCGVWSVKEIVAHLASYELVLIDVCATYLGTGAIPCLDRFLAQGPAFNDAEVELRQGQSAEEVLAEYTAVQARAAALAAQIPITDRRQAGRLPWYGTEYDLEDLLTYMFYGHKREHSAQVALFRDHLGR